MGVFRGGRPIPSIAQEMFVASIMASAVDSDSSRCGEGPYTLEHWFPECAGTESTRRYIFGEASPSLEVLTDHPGKAVLMSRRTM